MNKKKRAGWEEQEKEHERVEEKDVFIFVIV